MKTGTMRTMVGTLVILASLQSFATGGGEIGSATEGSRKIESMKASEAKIDIASVADSILLGKNQEKDISVRLVVEYYGQSTDVSPRKNLYLVFFHGGEMNNTKTAFNLGSVWELISTKRVSAGVYQIVVKDIEFKERKLLVDTTQVFIDDRKLVLENFEDPFFKSSIKVTQ